MKRFGLQQWLVVLALVLVVSFTGLFAIRTVRRAIYWHHHKDEPIRPWMSLVTLPVLMVCPRQFCIRRSIFLLKRAGLTDARSEKLLASKTVQSTK